MLAESKPLSDFFDTVLDTGAQAKLANWLIGPATAYLKEQKLEIADTELTPQNVCDLATSVSSNIISSTTAKQLLLDMMQTGGNVSDLIKEKDWLK